MKSSAAKAYNFEYNSASCFSISSERTSSANNGAVVFNIWTSYTNSLAVAFPTDLIMSRDCKYISYVINPLPSEFK